MRDLESLIRYDREHTGLDYKATLYHTGQHEALLKDVVAMANADIEGARYVILGVKLYPDGQRELLGIQPSQLPDPAVYQQLVRENVEPDLNIDLLQVSIAEGTFAVLALDPPRDPPYLMRKDFGGLRRGDGWIRKGSHQPRLDRRDLDRIYARKQAARGFQGALRVGFDDPGDPTTVSLPCVSTLDLPSDRAAEKIVAILHRRRLVGRSPFESMAMSSHFGTRTYDQSSDDQLRQDLERVKEDYSAEDAHVFHELLSSKFNLAIHNDADEPLEDVLVELFVPTQSGVIVADDVYEKPEYDYRGMRTNYRFAPTGYPDAEKTDSQIILRQRHDVVRHKRRTLAFNEAVRITLLKEAEGSAIEMEIRVHAKNLRAPYVSTLHINVEKCLSSTGADTSAA